MNDACLRAMEAISRAADGEQVTAEEAAEAKRHCASCPECARFSSTLAQIHTLPAPPLPEAVLERTLASMRTEAETAREAATTLKAEAAYLSAVQETETVPRPSPRNSYTAWIGAAAALIAVAVIVTIRGIGYMNDTPKDVAVQEDSFSLSQDTAGSSNKQAPPVAETLTQSDVQYVSFEGFAYRCIGASTDTPNEVMESARVISSLDVESRSITTRQVYLTDVEGQIFVRIDDSGACFIFAMVTRSFGSQLYGMSTDQIDSFGEWPTMPSSIPTPRRDDGGPAFAEAGVDDHARPIYAPPNADPHDGFAIAPGTIAGDPAAGNPGWTWWEPVP